MLLFEMDGSRWYKRRLGRGCSAGALHEIAAAATLRRPWHGIGWRVLRDPLARGVVGPWIGFFPSQARRRPCQRSRPAWGLGG